MGTQLLNQLEFGQMYSGSLLFLGRIGLGMNTDEIVFMGTNLSGQLGLGKITTFQGFSKPKVYLGKLDLITAGDQQSGMINKEGKLHVWIE